MKKITILLGIAFFALVTPVFASCSLGATPLSASAKAKPGSTVEVIWNLYNMYGDRSTHVTISFSSDADWGYEITPAVHDYQMNISGVIRDVTANLYLKSKPAVTYNPAVTSLGEGMVQHPYNKNEYIPTSPVRILIHVPEDVPIWDNERFTVTATGECFGSETGTLSTQVSTSLDINIETVSAEYYEEVVLQLPWYIEYLPVIITLAVLVMLLILLQYKPGIWKKLKRAKGKRK